jgi:hypothetical protein
LKSHRNPSSIPGPDRRNEQKSEDSDLTLAPFDRLRTSLGQIRGSTFPDFLTPSSDIRIPMRHGFEDVAA